MEEEGAPDLSQRVAQGHWPENQPNVQLKSNNKIESEKKETLSTLKHLQPHIHFSKVVPKRFKSFQWDKPPGRFRQFCNWYQAGGAACCKAPFFIPSSLHTLRAVSSNKLYVLCLNFITSNVLLKGEHKNVAKQSQHLHSLTKKLQLWRHFCNLISDRTALHRLFFWQLNLLPPFHITSAACSRNTHSLQVLSRLLATSAFYDLNMLSRTGCQKCPLRSQRSCGSISC